MEARRTVLGIVAMACAAVAVGALVSGGVRLPAPLALGPTAVVGAVAFVAALPLILRSWRTAFGVFLVWVFVEDLFRKLLGNDLRVYFAKDLIYLALLAALVLSPEARGIWRRATGQVRFALYALVAWAVVMSIPSLAVDLRLPLVGLRLDFLYAPLVIVGFLIARDAGELRKWLIGIAALTAVVSMIGIVQATVGPSFLAPSRATPGLDNLVLYRGFSAGTQFFRPTATFVEPGRFAQVAVLGVVVSLCSFLASRHRRRLASLALLVVNLGGVWVSGGRGAFLITGGLVLLAGLAGPVAHGSLAVGRAVAITVAAVLTVSVFTVLLPGLVGGRVDFYARTLDPRSEESEWAGRWDAHAGDTVEGLEIGGLIGEGTGQGSLGKQYLLGNTGYTIDSTGLYQVEGGYATVLLEWGVVGLALWLVWTVAWTARQWRVVRAARGNRIAVVGLMIVGWTILYLFVNFFSGFQGFQNYVVNAYFWIFSGIVFALPEAARSDSAALGRVDA